MHESYGANEGAHGRRLGARADHNTPTARLPTRREVPCGTGRQARQGSTRLAAANAKYSAQLCATHTVTASRRRGTPPDADTRHGNSAVEDATRIQDIKLSMRVRNVHMHTFGRHPEAADDIIRPSIGRCSPAQPVGKLCARPPARHHRPAHGHRHNATFRKARESIGSSATPLTARHPTGRQPTWADARMRAHVHAAHLQARVEFQAVLV